MNKVIKLVGVLFMFFMTIQLNAQEQSNTITEEVKKETIEALHLSNENNDTDHQCAKNCKKACCASKNLATTHCEKNCTKSCCSSKKKLINTKVIKSSCKRKKSCKTM